MAKGIGIIGLIKEKFSYDSNNNMLGGDKYPIRHVVVGANYPIPAYEFTTVLTRFDNTTRNETEYKKEWFEIGLQMPEFVERMADQRVWSEIKHPSDEDVDRYLSCDADETVAVLLKVWIEDDLLLGTFRTATFGKGENLYKFIDQGGRPTFSLRGCGKVATVNGKRIEYAHITTWDWVDHPSEQVAKMTTTVPVTVRATAEAGMMRESAMKSMSLGEFKKLTDRYADPNMIEREYVKNIDSKSRDAMFKESSKLFSHVVKSIPDKGVVLFDMGDPLFKEKKKIKTNALKLIG